MDMNIDINRIHANVFPLFWPVLWLNLYLLHRWHDQHGEHIGGISLAITCYGVIRVETIYPRADATLTHLRAFERATDNWCFDQLGFTADMFARANIVQLCEISGLVLGLINTAGFTPAPTINDSS